MNISRDLTDLFQPVKDGEEFRSVNPDGYEFIHGLVEHFIKQGILQVESDLTFEQKWEAYRNLMDEKEMPYRRVAERYIFMKR